MVGERAGGGKRMSIGEEEEKQKYFETKGLGKDGKGERVIKMYYCRKVRKVREG